jgi:phage-related protein (TIGR01555 family)
MGNVVSLLRDGLQSLVSRMGTDRDKAATTFYAPPLLTDDQIINAYRGAWLPRKIVDIPALDGCRKWRDWQAKKAQIEALENEEKRLGVKVKVLEAVKKARLFGGAAILIGTGDSDPASPLEPERVGKAGLKYLTVLTRRQLKAEAIERDPSSEFYGKPSSYTVSGANGEMLTIHPSRLAIFQGAMVPDDDLSVGMWNGWGESVLTATLDAIKNADSTAGNIASLVFEAKIDIIKVPQFSANIGNKAYEEKVLSRYTLANMIKGINGTLILDAEEEYESKAAAMGGLTDILMAFMQIVSGAADIPVTRLLGQSPAGMNSTGESDMKNYHDRIQAMQELDFQPAMQRLDECLMRSAGASSPDVYYQWAPLEQMSEKEMADIFKTNADAARQLVGSSAGQEIIPRDALSDALVNRLVEDGVLPGLDTAIEEYGSLSEQEPSIEEQAAALALEQAKQTPQQQKPGNGTHTQDAAPRTLYVSRDVLNGAEIVAWAKAQGFTSTLPASEMHVTITYSRAVVDWMQMGSSWEDEVKIPRGGARLMEKFGGATVLLFASNMLRWRHDEMVDKGASWDHDEYQPHITISYEGAPSDLSTVEPYQGEIHLGPEIFQEVKEDWQSNITEE